MLTKILDFLLYDLWQIPTAKKPTWLAIIIKKARVMVLAVRGFLSDQCQLSASALTFYVLLSIVPLFALLFGVAKGFGLEKLLEQKLLADFAGQEIIVTKIIDFSRKMLEHTKEGWIAGVGMIILFWTTIRLLSNIEGAFNYIWGVKNYRTWIRRISDYLSLIMICPILIISSSTITVLISGKLSETMDYLIGLWAPLKHFEFIVFFAIQIIPYLVLWILFTFIYIFVPNTKVRFSPALTAGIITAIAFNIWQWIYIKSQIYLTSYGAIYGSFSALPLFLIWLQVSWLIILFGAQIAYAVQNVSLFEFDPVSRKLSNYNKKIVALNIVNLCIEQFKNNKKLSAEEISQALNIPIRLINKLIHQLTEADILSEVNSPNLETVYQPARVIQELNIAEVTDLMEKAGVVDLPFDFTAHSEKIQESYDQLIQENKKSKNNILLG